MYEPRLLLDNRFADAVLSASSTAAGNFNVNNLNDSRTNSWWQPLSMPSTVTVDCGVARSADTLGIVGHNLGSKGCTLELRGSTDNFAASNVLVASTSPTTDALNLKQFTSASYRYWRAKIHGNKLLASNDFTSSAWINTICTITPLSNGYTTISDNDTIDYGYLSNSIPCVPNKIYKVCVSVKKDAIGGAVRFCMLRVAISGGVGVSVDIVIDSSSGSVNIVNNGISNVIFSSVDAADSWLISVQGSSSDNLSSSVAVRFFPAVSRTSPFSYSGAITGSVDIRDVMIQPEEAFLIPPGIACILAGNALVLPQPVENGFDPVGLKLQGNIEVSRKGNPLGRTIDYQTWSERIKLPYIRESWLRATWLPNWPALRGTPMVFAWDADAHPADVYWVVMGDNFAAPHKSGGYCDLEFDLSGVAP